MYRVLILFLVSSFAFANDFEFKSTPSNAKISLYKSADASPIKLGNTPLKLSGADIFRHLGDKKTFIVSISKDGFDEYRVMMIKSEKANFEISTKLKTNVEIKTIKKHDMLISELFKVQRLIRSNNFSDALAMLEKLEQDHKGFSIIPELKGITYYMKRDVNKALSMFRLAFGENPQNKDAYKMKVYLEKKLGIDTEVSQ